MIPTLRVATAVIAAGSLALGTAACSKTETATPTTTTAAAGATTTVAGAGTTAPAAGTTVTVTLTEWEFKATAKTAPAGKVTFTAKNDGKEVHELVLFKTDLPTDKLPLDEEGAVDERATGIEVVDEVEDVKPGETKSFPTDLKPGTYALVCNVVDKGEKHYGHKMYTTFTVT